MLHSGGKKQSSMDFFLIIYFLYHHFYQRWSRGHKARGRGQGQGQPFRGQTLSRPRTGMLEAKAKDQGHKRKCSRKKRSSQKFFRRSPQKNVFQKIFQALHIILTIQKIVLPNSVYQKIVLFKKYVCVIHTRS